MPHVKAAKSFRDSETGKFVTRGDDMSVSEARHKELSKVRPPLVTPLYDEKAAPPVQNQMAPAAANKMLTHDVIRNKDARVPLTEPGAAEQLAEHAQRGKVALNDPAAADKLAQSGPLPSAGGETGAADLLSSSAPGLQPQRGKSPKPKGARG